MKRFLCLVLSVILCATFCSCTNKNVKYAKQGNISFNYNNIVNSTYTHWIDENGIYDVDIKLGTLSVFDETGNHRIALQKAPNSRIQTYDGQIYFLNSTTKHADDSEYSLVKYDMSAKEETVLVTFQAQEAFQWCIVENFLYVSVSRCDDLAEDLKAISLETNEITSVANDVFGWGVVDGSVRYIVRSDNEYTAYTYDVCNQTSILIGQFEIELQNSDAYCWYWGINFTSDKIILAVCFSNNAMLLVYHVQTTALESCEFDSAFSALSIAYDKYIFIATTQKVENDSDLQKNKVHRVCLEDFQMEEIGEFDGNVDLFVTSDDDVFVSSSAFDEIYHCTSQGIGENILVNKK